MKKYFLSIILIAGLRIISYSQCGTGSCVPGVFSIVAAGTTTQTTVALSWNASAGATQYTVYYKLEASPTWTQGVFCPSCTSSTQGGLQPGGSYNFYVEAWQTTTTTSGSDCDGCRNSSNQVTAVTLPAVPTGVNANASPTLYQINVSWLTAAGATSYTVRYAVSGSAAWATACPNTTALTCAITTGLTGNTVYDVQVRSNTAVNNSLFSSTANATIIPGAPTALSATPLSESSFRANWSEPAGLSPRYTLQVSTEAGVVVQTIPNIVGPSHVVTSLSPGTKYNYAVKADNGTGSSAYLNNATPVQTTPAIPTGVNATASTLAREITVDWAPGVFGANNYDVQYRIAPDGGWNPICTGTTSTSCPIIGLVGNTEYDIQVRANNATRSLFSDPPIRRTTIPGVPTGLTATPLSESSFRANWSAPTGLAPRYTLQVSTEAGVVVRTIPDIVGLSYDVTSLTPGTKYNYAVKADNGIGSSGYLNSGTPVQTTPQTPTAVTALASTVAREITVNWLAVTGATSYDVRYQIASSGNWTDICTGTSSTNCPIIGLQGNTDYDIQVRANNATSSEFSLPQRERTIPGVPVGISATDVTQNSFTVNWSAPAGQADSYTLRVATDPIFSTVLRTFTITGFNQVVPSLTPGTEYYYQVQAENGVGVSADLTSVIPVRTTPATPTGVAADASTLATDINVSWPLVYGATNYDVQYKAASASTWTDICTGTTSTSCLIADLKGNTAYDTRVRANNATSSPFSLQETETTIPKAPTAPSTSVPTSSGFTASWTANPTGAAFYEVEVSSNDAFTSLVPDYNPKRIPGTQTTAAVIGLNSSTIYWWRVRAGNLSGTSSFSEVKTLGTNLGSGESNYDVTWTDLSYNETYDPAHNRISLTVKAFFYPLTATLYYRKVSETAFQQTQTLINGNPNESKPVGWNIQSDWVDEMGFEFKIKIADNSDRMKEVTLRSVRIKVANWIIEPERFGKSAKDYVIISAPYEMSENIEDTFEQTQVAGPYDPGVWRLLRYENGANNDYANGLSKTTMARGKSYWFLSRSSITMQFGEMISPPNTQSNPFVLHLEKGWNQIASPYPFPIDWNDVLNSNGNPTGIGKLKVFDSALLGFKEGSTLKAFSGGFVFSDVAADVVIPVTRDVNPDDGRKATDDEKEFSESPDEPAWFVPIVVRHDEVTNLLGGFGMHPKANVMKDKFDEVTLPRFVSYLEWNSAHHGESMTDFTRDVIPRQSAYTWTFSADHNGSSAPVTMSWNNKPMIESKASIILHDLSNNSLVNLKDVNSYTFTGNKRTFKIYYNAEGTQLANTVELGVPYPNPAYEKVTIPFDFTNTSETRNAGLELFNSTGTKISDAIVTQTHSGLHEIEWNCSGSNGEKVPAGIYFFRLYRFDLTGQSQTFSGRIVVN
jgi:hypothetical protein